MGEAVGLADDEVVEGVLRVQSRFVPQLRGLLHRGLDAHGLVATEVRDGDRRGGLLGELVVHDDAIRGDLFTDVGEGLHDRQPQTLVDLCGGEIVRDLEIKRRSHHTGRNRQAQEALKLRGDPVVVDEELLHRGPDRNVGLGW